MKSLIQQSQHICAGIRRAQAGSYFRHFNNVSDAQLQRFQSAAAKRRDKDSSGVWFDLWMDAEGELVARNFEVQR